MEWAQATKKQLDMTLFYFVFCIAYNHVAGAFESRALFFIAKNDCGNSITRQNIGLWMLVMFTRWGQSTLTISREKKNIQNNTLLFALFVKTQNQIEMRRSQMLLFVFFTYFFYSFIESPIHILFLSNIQNHMYIINPSKKIPICLWL